MNTNIKSQYLNQLFCLKDKQKFDEKKYNIRLNDHNRNYDITRAKPQLTGDKEWVNSVYLYNKNAVKPLVAADTVTEQLVKSYFNFDVPQKLSTGEKKRNTHLANVAKRLSINKMLTSKAEIKHFNDKGIMTVFLYNRNSKVTDYKIKKEFSLVSHSNKRVKNKSSHSISSLTAFSTLLKARQGQALYPNTKTGKQDKEILKTENRKNVYLKTRLGCVNKVRKTRFFLNYIAREKKNIKLLARHNKKIIKSINLFKYPQLELYKLNLFLLTDAKKKHPQPINFKLGDKKKIYKTKHNKYTKLYYDTRKIYKKYYILKKILFLSSARKSSLLNFSAVQFNKYLSKNKLFVSLYMLKIISIETIIKLFSIIKKINKSNKLNISRKNDIIKLIRSNVIKKYDLSNFSSYLLLANGKAIQGQNETRYFTPYTGELNIIEKHRKIKINNLHRKKRLYLYYTQKLAFNNNKLKNWFMLGIKSLLSKIYNKKMELNIVNLKYLYLNSHNLVEAISTKLMNRKNRLLKVLKKTIRTVTLPSQQVYPYQYGESIANNNNANIFDVGNYVLNAMEHRDVNGVRIEASGRLTKRITASRSVFKVKYKGSLRDPETISTGNKKKSSAVLVGHKKANIQYGNAKSKTIIGSFGLKVSVSSFNLSPR